VSLLQAFYHRYYKSIYSFQPYISTYLLSYLEVTSREYMDLQNLLDFTNPGHRV